MNTWTKLLFRILYYKGKQKEEKLYGTKILMVKQLVYIGNRKTKLPKKKSLSLAKKILQPVTMGRPW